MDNRVVSREWGQKEIGMESIMQQPQSQGLGQWQIEQLRGWYPREFEGLHPI